MIQRMRTIQEAREEGFTLIELLIVIVILGVLSGIVVFAVGGITDRGNTAACKADKKNYEVAQEAYFAKNASYAADGAALVTAKLIKEESAYVTTGATGAVALAAGAPAGC